MFPELLLCCGTRPRAARYPEKYLASRPHTAYHDHVTTTEVADQIVAKLLAPGTADTLSQADIQSAIHDLGWYDGLAAAVLARLENAIKLREKMGPAMESAYDRATAEVNRVVEWARENPEMAAVLVTLVALGILAIMTPWLMAWLGFAEEGIVEASWAARWQATYRGFVPARSLFSYLQSLGTKIGQNWHG